MSVEVFSFDSSRSPVSFLRLIDFGDRNERSRNRPVILRETNVNKIRRPSSGSPICLITKYDYKPNWTTRSPVTN